MENQVAYRKKAAVLSVHALGLVNVGWQRACAWWRHNWGRSVGTLFLCKNVCEDVVGPATSSQGFSVLVDAELVRTALKREQSVLSTEF